MCAVSVSQNVRECVLGRREYIYSILVVIPALNARDKIKVADVIVNTNYVTFLTNRFPRLISLSTSTIFVSGTCGITAILKYRSVNPIRSYPSAEKQSVYSTTLADWTTKQNEPTIYYFF